MVNYSIVCKNVFFQNFNLLKLLYSWKWRQYCNKSVTISNRICERTKISVTHNTIPVRKIKLNWSGKLTSILSQYLDDLSRHIRLQTLRVIAMISTHQIINMRVTGWLGRESRHKPQLAPDHPVVQCNKSLALPQPFVSVNWHSTSWEHHAKNKN